jgi:hypothetical protein
MVIQELTQRTAPIETAICNAKWKPRNRGQCQTERDRVRIREIEMRNMTEEDREKEAKWLS